MRRALYSFTNLSAGTYEVKFVNPVGENFTLTGQGANTGADSNANTTTGITAPIVLTAGQTDLTIDAGLVMPVVPASGVLGDRVWLDTNSNGVQDSGESGVAGVTVDLLNAAGTSTLAVTTTNASGLYSFTNLAAGTYEVKFVAANGNTFTLAGQGANTGADSNANVTTGITSQIVLAAGQTDLTIDAGLVAPPPSAALGDRVWFDNNANGIQDSGETGVAGVTVDLLNAAGTSTLAVTTTNATGLYSFTNLAAGTYEVKFVNSGANVFTQAGQGPAATDSNANVTTGITAQIVLAAGQTDLTIDAGLTTVNAALGDRVWLDTNNNGVQDSGETGVAGVTVDLLNAAGNATLAVTTTNASGLYSFTNLAAGTYEVKFVQPTGKNFTLAGQGANTAADSNANTVTGITSQIVLTAGQTDLSIDAGLVTPVVTPNTAALGDKVWCDANGNGIQDTNEAGVAGVTVDLLNAAGTSILAVTTTNASGLYRFTNLAAGTYEVKFVAPTGEKFTLATQGTNGGVDSNPNASTGVTGPITLAAGQTDLTIDAGLVTNAGISVNKIASKAVVNACGQVTYQFDVTNTGTAPLTNIKITDNIGSAAHPDIITPSAIKVSYYGVNYNSGDVNHNNLLDAGEAWHYQVTTTPVQINANDCGTVSHTCTGGNLHSGNTAWFNCSFTPTSTKDGTCYVFHDVQCNVKGYGTGAGGYNQKCPDAEVRFSSSCTSAKTVYDEDRDCWVTTLPANCTPGKVFLTGCPVEVPSGCDFTNANCTWTIGDSGNNCGATSLNWSAGCKGYTSFDNNGYDGKSDYNQIGVKVCDNRTEYGNGGSTTCGPDGGGWQWNGYRWSYNDNGWVGSNSDCAGTPENHYTSGACGTGGYWGGYGSSGGCGTGTTNTCNQTQVGADGVADTVTVTAQTACATVSHTCSGGNLHTGNTAWFNCNFTPKSTANGTCYVFRDVHCKVTESNGKTRDVDCGDAEIRFSSSCTKATTAYNSARQCWVTTLPANCTPGKVFMTGCPVTVPSGSDYTNAKCDWTIGDSGNNCGDSSSSWNAQCSGYNSFSANGNNGCTDYNKIGVKVCDNNDGYGQGGSTNSGYGWCGTGWGNTGGWSNTGCGWSYQSNNWCGSSSDRCGTPENQFVNDSCDGAASSGGYYGGGWGGYGYNCGSSSTGNGGGTGSSGGCAQQCVPSGCDPCAVVPATCCGPVTVTASDTTEVIVIDKTNKISVDGVVPTGSLTALYGKAQTLEFVYNASNTVSTKTASIGLSLGSNTNSMAFIEISNNANPFASNAQIYFQGTVSSGQKLFADAAINSLTNTENTGVAAFMSTSAGQGICAFIFNSRADFLAGAAPIQTDYYNTSGNLAMGLNDQIGSLKLVGYIGSTGGHLMS